MPEHQTHLDPVLHTLTLPEGTLQLSPQQTRYLLILHTYPDGLPVNKLDSLMRIRRNETVKNDLAKVIASTLLRKIAARFSIQVAAGLISREQIPGTSRRTSLHRLINPENFNLITEKYGLHEGDHYYYMDQEFDRYWHLIDLSNSTVSTPDQDVTLSKTARDLAYTQLAFRGETFDILTLNETTNQTLGTCHAVVKLYEPIRRLAKATSFVELNEIDSPITTKIDTAARITGVIHKPGHRRLHE